jgi:hypothetical protein
MEIVNGYVCQTCCDAGLAARNIDPAHPKDGPFGQDKRPDPSHPKEAGTARDAHGPAVLLGSRLATDVARATNRTAATSRVDPEARVGTPPSPGLGAPGAALDLTA